MKIKKLSNLKLRTKKLGTTAVFFLLLSLAITAVATNNVIKMPSGSTAGSVLGLDVIRNSNGNTWTALGSNIQTAVNDGEVVWLPPGNFTISPTIYLKNDTQLIGSGNATILYLADDVNASVLQSNSSHNIVIRDLLIDGNMNNNCNGYSGGIYLKGCNYVTVENVGMKRTYSNSFSSDIDGTTYSSNITVKDCYFYDGNGDAAIRIYKTNHFSVISNYVFNCYVGIYINTVNYGDIIGNIIQNGNGDDNIDAGVGQSMGILLYSSHYLSVTSNTIDGMQQSVSDGSAGNGITINVATFCTVSANIIQNNDADGIKTLGNAGHCTISNNIICNNCRGTTSSTSEVTFNDAIGYNVLSGNKILETGARKCDYLFNISNAGCDNNLISGNLLSGVTASYMMNFASSNNLVIGNPGYFTVFPTVNITGTRAGGGWFNASTNVLNLYNGTAWVSTTFT